MPRAGSGEPVIAPLATEHVPDVAALVAARVRMLRTAIPAVPAAWQDEAAIARLVLGLAVRGTGVVALRDGTPVGFQAATYIDGHGGRWVYTSDVGHAAAGGGRARTVAAMYASLAEGWVRDACLEHVVTILADDAEIMDAFSRLGFGRTVVDLVRDLEPVRAAPSASGLEIRRAGIGDVAAVHALGEGLRRHLAASPVFRRSRSSPSPELLRREFADPASATFLATNDGRGIACMRIGPSATDVATIVRDPGTASIIGAFTVPDCRGEGVATSLLDEALGWARSAGYTRAAVDHESANGEAERFWARHFTPVAYSMTRHVPPRVGP